MRARLLTHTNIHKHAQQTHTHTPTHITGALTMDCYTKFIDQNPRTAHEQTSSTTVAVVVRSLARPRHIAKPKNPIKIMRCVCFVCLRECVWYVE